MNLNFLVKNLAYVALFVTLISCEDHQTAPGTQRFRLKKTVNSTSVSPTFTTIYNYNSAGKLASYVESSPAQNPVITTLQYDNQGRLVAMEEKATGIVIGSTTQDIVTGRATYDYDGNGNITSITKYTDDPNQAKGNLTVKEITLLEYGANKLPGKVTIMNNGVATSQFLYSYTNGNIVKIDYPEAGNGGQIISSTTFLYDDKPNPYYGLLTFRQNIFNTINRNNAYISPTTNMFEYNSDGLLIKSLGSRLLAQTTYEYEAY